jgi:hypothetical protein
VDKLNNSLSGAAFGLAPTIVWTTSSPWYTFNVGMDIMPYFAAVVGFWSILRKCNKITYALDGVIV